MTFKSVHAVFTWSGSFKFWDGAPPQDLLNQALKKDTLDDGYILCISIYYAFGHVGHGSRDEGQHPQVSIHHGSVNLADLLRAEVVGNHSSSKSIGREPGSTLDSGTGGVEEDLVRTGQDTSAEMKSGRSKAGKMGKKMLITVSVSEEIQDDLRRLVRGYLDERVSLLELEYQL